MQPFMQPFMRPQDSLRRGLGQMRRDISDLAGALSSRHHERIYRDIRYRLAALRFEAALVAHAHVCRKAGFKEDQPRWPKGSGEISGRWSGGGGLVAAGLRRSGRSFGHHLLPREIYEKEPLKPETRRVFEDATIGPLRAQRHNYGEGHPEYNKAAYELFNRFKAENGIRSEDMEPQQARKLLDEIRGSSDPRIRNLNWRIIMRELRYYIRRGRGTE